MVSWPFSRYDSDWRVGLEPKTGKELYRIPKEDAVAPVGSYRSLEESSGPLLSAISSTANKSRIS